ncbi:MAG: thioredoxin domain-containing protein [Halolamina sp.]
MTSRRAFLGSVAGMAALAGCGGDSSQSLSEHPASTALAAQPTVGTEPGEGEGTVIAFEDPSCPTCARFERSTFPKLKTELLDTGRASFVFRSIPVVYDWGEPATMALEATYDRSASAFWALKDHYYRQQDGFDTDNVLSKTETFLDENTEVDAAAVADDAEAGAYQDAVNTDLSVADELGVNGTPTFYVFDSGTFSTDITGAAGYDSLKGAMGI